MSSLEVAVKCMWRREDEQLPEKEEEEEEERNSSLCFWSCAREICVASNATDLHIALAAEGD